MMEFQQFKDAEGLARWATRNGDKSFDPAAMRVMRSRIVCLVPGLPDVPATWNLYVTSQKSQDGSRRFTVRQLLPSGTSQLISEEDQFTGQRTAVSFARRWVGAFEKDKAAVTEETEHA